MSDDKQLRFLETAQKIAAMTDSKQRTKAIREFILELSVNASTLNSMELMLLTEMARIDKFTREQMQRIEDAWPKDGKCTPPKCEMCGRLYGRDKWENRYDRETLTTTFKHCCKDTGHE